MRLPMVLWRGERISVLTIKGCLHADTLGVLEVGLEAALAKRAGTIAVDLKRVTSVEPAGASALRYAHDLALSHGSWLILINVGPDVAAQLTAAGVAQVMDVYGTGFDEDGPPRISPPRAASSRS